MKSKFVKDFFYIYEKRKCSALYLVFLPPVNMLWFMKNIFLVILVSKLVFSSITVLLTLKSGTAVLKGWSVRNAGNDFREWLTV